MNVIAWLMLANMLLMCLGIWQLYMSSNMLNHIDEFYKNSFSRQTDIINKLLELKDK